MNRWNRNWMLLLLAALLVCFGTAQARQTAGKTEGKESPAKKLQIGNLPPAVQKTAQEQTKGATIKNIVAEKEAGKTVYEIESVVTATGRARDMVIDASGQVIDLEEEIDFASLPEALQAEMKKSLGAGKVVKLEAASKNGTITGYEAIVARGGKQLAIEMGPDGKIPPAKPKK